MKQHGNITVLSGDQLSAIAAQMIKEKDPTKARKLKDKMIEGFYGKGVRQLRAENPQPWLVKERDFRRYPRRAMDACRRRHVIFFYHNDGGKRQLMVMAPHRDWRRAVEVALVNFTVGAYRRVTLSKLPRRKSR